MVGKKGNTLLSEITKTEKTTEKRQPEKWAAEIGQPENSATKNDSVDKRETQSYIVSRRDSNSCLGNRKKWPSENGHLFTSCCHTDDAAAGLCYTGLPENHR